MKKIREWISIKIAKAPAFVVLMSILTANIVFISIAALIIMSLAPASLENTDFWSCVYYAVTMLVTGYADIIDIGETGFLLIAFCMFTVIIGMIVFTGAVIGYVTEFISSFIENADSGSHKLHVSDHTVILNWNNRAAEIINELLYKNTKETVVILVDGNKNEVTDDINERLSDTIDTEYEAIKEESGKMRFFARRRFLRNNRLRNKLNVIVREGDTQSTKQLEDISIQFAKSVIILSDDNPAVTERPQDYSEYVGKGSISIIKTVLQVTHLSSEEGSRDNQQIVVEVKDDWILMLIETVIEQKMKDGRDSIIPVSANRILGQVFSQFSIMPELNVLFSRLFSNKGTSIFVQLSEDNDISEEEYITGYLNSRLYGVPITTMKGNDGKTYCYYMADREDSINIISPEAVSVRKDLLLSINPDFEIRNKHVIILGHNSKSISIMEGYKAFCSEWALKDGSDVLDITVIDDEKSLAELKYYEEYPFVKNVISSSIYDKNRICGVLDGYIKENSGNCCIILLSNDMVADEDIDADVLTYLVLVQDIFNRRLREDPMFDLGSIDLVVEILNPKNHEIIRNYSADNIVVSNRYISKMIMQIGEKREIFNLYNDILSYDEPDQATEGSKEMYIKKADEFFTLIPGPCSAAELIRSVYYQSPAENKSILLGYIPEGGEMVLFGGRQTDTSVKLSGKDKLILFSNH